MIEELVAKHRTFFPKGVRARFSEGLNVVVGQDRARFLFEIMASALGREIAKEGLARVKLKGDGKEVVILYDAERKLRRIVGKMPDVNIVDAEEYVEMEDVERAEIRKAWLGEEIRRINERKSIGKNIAWVKDEFEHVKKSSEELKELERKREEIKSEVAEVKLEELEKKLSSIKLLEDICARERSRIADEIYSLQDALEIQKPKPFWKRATFILGVSLSILSILIAPYIPPSIWVVLPVVFSVGVISLIVTFFVQMRAYEKMARIESALKERLEEGTLYSKSIKKVEEDFKKDFETLGAKNLEEVEIKIREIRKRQEELMSIERRLEELRRVVESKKPEELEKTLSALESELKATEIMSEVKIEEVLEELRKLESIKPEKVQFAASIMWGIPEDMSEDDVLELATESQVILFVQKSPHGAKKILRVQ